MSGPVRPWSLPRGHGTRFCGGVAARDRDVGMAMAGAAARAREWAGAGGGARAGACGEALGGRPFGAFVRSARVALDRAVHGVSGTCLRLQDPTPSCTQPPTPLSCAPSLWGDRAQGQVHRGLLQERSWRRTLACRFGGECRWIPD